MVDGRSGSRMRTEKVLIEKGTQEHYGGQDESDTRGGTPNLNVGPSEARHELTRF